MNSWGGSGVRSDEASWLKSNATYWDGMAERWQAGRADRSPEQLQRAGRDIIQALDGRPDDLILDAGCGDGRWALALADAGYRVRAVDLAPAMVAAAEAAARRRDLAAERLQVQRGDLAHLPFPDETFDGLICVTALQFAPSPGAALVELRRVLKPGKRLVLIVPGAHSPIRRDAWRRFRPDAAPIDTGILPWEVEALLSDLGWAIETQSGGYAPSVSGQPNRYTAAMAARLPDPILQQTVATIWWFLASKRG